MWDEEEYKRRLAAMKRNQVLNMRLLNKERLEDEIKEVRKLHQGCRDLSWALHFEAGVAFLVVSYTTRGGAKATRRTVVHAHGYYF